MRGLVGNVVNVTPSQLNLQYMFLFSADLVNVYLV